MSYQPVATFFGTIASGASTMTQVDLSKGWSRVFVEISTMSANAALDIYCSQDGTTFRQVFERVNTAPVQYQTLTVATNVIGTTGGIAPVDVHTRYLQLRASATIAGGASFTFHCTD